jgi:RNAse (barnase) inhibitor barstar
MSDILNQRFHNEFVKHFGKPNNGVTNLSSYDPVLSVPEDEKDLRIRIKNLEKKVQQQQETLDQAVNRISLIMARMTEGYK